MQISDKNRYFIQEASIAVLIFVISALIYGAPGCNGMLIRDDAIYLYSGQQAAKGVPPYVSSFEIKGPLSPLIVGFGVMISNILDCDDLHVVRLGFLLISCLAVLSIYLLGNSLFRSRRVAILGALTSLTFYYFAIHAAAGPRPKTPLVLFISLTLLFSGKKQWFWAGLFSSLAVLTWQPMGIFPLMTIFLSVAAESERQRKVSALCRVLAGIGLPLLLIIAYFAHHGALYDFLDGFIFFNLRNPDRIQGISFIKNFLRVLRIVWVSERAMYLSTLIGFITVLYWYPSRYISYRSVKDMISKDRFAPLLLSFPLLCIWTLVDVQGPPDLFVFHPYISLGFASFLDLALKHAEEAKDLRFRRKTIPFLSIAMCITLLMVSCTQVRQIREKNKREGGIARQRKVANKIAARFGKDAKIICIEAPQILTLLHLKNPNPYIFINAGIDRRIHYATPGGFEGWIREMEAYDPDVIITGRLYGGVYMPKLTNWLKTNYHEEKLGCWTLRIKIRRKDSIG
ncbi:MAG: hypothetical protein A2Z72_07355 [Omnitrophica bacterium RBG_13_46_9]|nr:MAG: hypothetical protein A2Z72_07355 [Omnitrophica bacterium RBG_13_46_9]